MRWRSGLVSAVVVLLALAGVGAGLRYGLQRDALVRTGSVDLAGTTEQPAGVTGTWTEVTLPPPPILAADALFAKTALFAEPNVPFPDDVVLDNPTWEKLPLVFEVLAQRGGWVQVRVSMRPNGATAWVRATDVRIRPVRYRIQVSLGAHRVRVLDGTKVLLDEPAVIGRPEDPTPTGHFFVDGVVDTHDPGGPYGPIQISVSGFSDTLTEFGGGIGQIAIHGTNQPELRGTAASHGCVRVSNDAIGRLMWLAPTGTPVDIVD